MASKYQLISSLSERAAEDVTRSPVHWMGISIQHPDCIGIPFMNSS